MLATRDVLSDRLRAMLGAVLALEDVLGEVLATARTGGVLTVQAELTAPWGIQFPDGPVAAFHILTAGSCLVRTRGSSSVRMMPGDVVLFTRGSAHALLSGPAARPVPFSTLRCDAAVGVPILRLGGGGGTTASLLCGVYRFEPDTPHPVLSLLPEVLRSRGDRDVAAVLALLRREVRERPPAVGSVVARLVDLLFIYLVRAWLAKEPEGRGGWLGAMRDRRIGRALSLLHQSVERRWTVEQLATETGMSRAAFARRFTTLVGSTPLGYLTELRMRRAARLLRDTDRSLADVAELVGYDSAYAFNRAFSRARGISPGRYRRGAA